MSNVPSLLEDIQCCNMLPPSRRANWQHSTERDWAFDGDWHTYGSLAKECNWRTGMARGRDSVALTAHRQLILEKKLNKIKSPMHLNEQVIPVWDRFRVSDFFTFLVRFTANFKKFFLNVQGDDAL